MWRVLQDGTELVDHLAAPGGNLADEVGRLVGFALRLIRRPLEREHLVEDLNGIVHVLVRDSIVNVFCPLCETLRHAAVDTPERSILESLFRIDRGLQWHAKKFRRNVGRILLVVWQGLQGRNQPLRADVERELDIVFGNVVGVVIVRAQRCGKVLVEALEDLPDSVKVILLAELGVGYNIKQRRGVGTDDDGPRLHLLSFADVLDAGEEVDEERIGLHEELADAEPVALEDGQ